MLVNQIPKTTFGITEPQVVEAEYLSTNYQQAERLAQIVLQQAKTLLEKLKVYEVLIQLYMAKNQIQTALDTALLVLKMLDVHLEKAPPKQLVIENCDALPKMTAPNKLAAMRILNFAISPSYTVAPELFPQIVFTMVKLSAEYGNSALSVFGYSSYGLLLCAAGYIESGYQAGQLAINLLEKFDARELKAKGLAAYNVGIHHWKRHAKETIAPLCEGSQSGLETGDVEFVGVTAMHCGSYLFWVGEPLETVAQQQKKFHALLQRLKQKYQLVYLKIWQQTVFNLQGLNSEPCRLIGEALNEEEILPNVLKTNYGMAIFAIYLSKSMLYYWFKDFTQSVANAVLAKNYEQTNVGVMVVPIHKFYYSLALLATYSNTSVDQQPEIIHQVESHQKQMKLWASHAPSNYQHRYNLVEAEKARILGQPEAIEWYEKAIAGAKENEYIQEEALAYELAAEFYLGRCMEKFAQIYLKEAHYRYQQWGAVAKVKDLEQRYPQWLDKKTIFHQMTTTSTISETRMVSTTIKGSSQLDLNSIMKATQTLSGEIVLDRLLEKMMHIVIENVGAEKGFLLLPKQDKWFIEAEGHIENSNTTVLQSLPLEKTEQMPANIIHYVARTQENIVLYDATQEGHFTSDAYIVKHSPKSVLCVPLLNKGQLTGILYFENNLTTKAFTPARFEVLKILSSQLAISIENALLYQKLEQKTGQLAQRTEQLAKANQEITGLNEQLKFENLRMSAELDVSRQLQQMLLPGEEEFKQIDGLDIAGFMEPADEVGGDYYDVLQQSGRVLFGIGDVTGHGLESGALAIMVQSSVRTLLANNETDPVKFFNALNQMVFHNVQRMKADKNLTLALVDYIDNQLYFSGQHEEIIVVQNGKLELIDTLNLGFPIGLDNNITEFVNQAVIPLKAGDVVVLYTDGITEAENIEKQMYGQKRLCEVILQNWQKMAQEIQQAVIDDVRQFIGEQKVFDDITLLVLKQK